MVDKTLYFIHIPKTGGTSVRESLKNEHPELSLVHNTHDHILKHIKIKDLDNYFKFAFVRNPWDRLVSTFFHLSNENSRVHHHSRVRSKEYYKRYNGNFDLFMKDFAKGHIPYKRLYKPQYKLTTYNKYLFKTCNIPDFIGKFESLQSDFEKLCEMLDLKKYKLPFMRTSKHKHYTSYYNDWSKKVVEKIYKKDIMLFDYTFD